MSRRAVHCLVAGVALPAALLADLVLSAGPAAAHNVSAGSLPASSALLGYVGAFAVLATAVALRSSWPKARLHLGVGEGTGAVDPEALAPGAARERAGWLAWAGHLLGLALLALVVAGAIIGPNTNAENITPTAVFTVWRVGLPIVCLVAGDVMGLLDPFSPLVAAGQRLLGRTDPGPPAAAPSWTAAAFFWAFSWVFLAYHSPGSPRVVAVLLLAYTAAAVAGGLRWGRAWVRTGEGFGALSYGVGHLLRRRDVPRPAGLLPLLAVWVGATAFDAVSSTGWWVDVLGTHVGWSRTAVNTVGLAWITGVAGLAILLAVRVLERRVVPRAVDDCDEAVTVPRSPAGPFLALLGLALVPIAVAWSVAHDLTLLLFEGQNFYALLSDPIGRGWDLFGTINHTIDYRLYTEGWVRWVQLGALLLGHTGAVVLAHDGALRALGRKRGMQVTWAVAVLAAGSVVAAALLVLK